MFLGLGRRGSFFPQGAGGGGSPAGIYFAFRSTSGFVTDPTNEIFVGLTTYPTVRGGYSFGYDTGTGAVGAADHNADDPTMLAGIHFLQNSGGGIAPKDWLLDLTAFGGPGTYKIGLALGTSDASWPDQNVQILDDTTPKFTATGSSGVETFVDATGVVRAAAAWASGQAYRTVSFASSTLVLRLADPAGTGYTTLACLYVERTGP